MYRLITAPDKIDIVGPSVFLVGPIKNAPDWQAQAIPLLLPHANVLNPRRPNIENALSPAEKQEQCSWEFAGQKRADVIVVWLTNSNNPESQRMIGRDSRTELGVHIGAKRLMCIGIEPGFPGEEWLRRLCHYYMYVAWSSLEDTCEAAIRYLNHLKGLPE